MSSLPNLTVLDETVGRLVNRIEKNSATLCARIPYFEERILKPLRALKRIGFHTHTSDASFELNSARNAVLFNAGHIAKIIQQIELAEGAFAGRPNASEDLRQLQTMSTDLFVLHEIDHIGQGVPTFEDVQAIKLTEGPGFIAKLDILSDRDAAVTAAWLNAIEKGDSSYEAYKHYFLEALFFLCVACVPAFGVRLDRQDKVSRALGIYLMLVRISEGERLGLHPSFLDGSFLSIDAPLMPTFSKDWRILTVSTTDLQVLVPNGEMNPLWGPGFAIHLQRGQFQQALDVAINIARKLFTQNLPGPLG